VLEVRNRKQLIDNARENGQIMMENNLKKIPHLQKSLGGKGKRMMIGLTFPTH